MRAAVDVVGDAGDVARLLATEEGDEIGDVMDVATAADWNLGDELRPALARKRPASDVGFDEAGCDGVDCHPVRPQFSGQCSCEAEPAALAAEYATAPNTPPPRSAETEDKKTMRPKPRSTRPVQPDG